MAISLSAVNSNTKAPYLYRGVVEDNIDPDNLGKCKVRVFGVHGSVESNTMLPWARPLATGTVSATRGTLNLPDIGDIVWVLFEGADKEYPVYIGGAYSSGDIKIDPNKTILYTEEGNQIVYDREKKSYTINVGNNGIIINNDHITILGDLQIKGNIQVEGGMELTGEVSTGVSLTIEEVIIGEPNSDDPDIVDDTGSTPTPPSGDTSEKSLYVTNNVGINRLSDSQSFCNSLVTTIEVQCRDENGGTYTKKLTVNTYLADDIRSIFQEIYDNTTFRIRSGDTGAYCYRKISGKDKLSYHSYGVAIDLNWNLNPYSSSAGGSDDDLRIRTTSHPVVQIFYNHGWGWGGTYHDLMHFSYFNGW